MNALGARKAPEMEFGRTCVAARARRSGDSGSVAGSKGESAVVGSSFMAWPSFYPLWYAWVSLEPERTRQRPKNRLNSLYYLQQ